jgi:hypothetical protein
MQHKELRRHKGRVRLNIDELTLLIREQYDVSPEFEIQAAYAGDNFDLITLLAIDPAYDTIPEGGLIPIYYLTRK